MLCLEIKDWPSLMDWFVVKVSREVQNLKKRMIRIKDLTFFFSAHPCLCKRFLNMEHFFYLFFIFCG